MNWPSSGPAFPATAAPPGCEPDLAAGQGGESAPRGFFLTGAGGLMVRDRLQKKGPRVFTPGVGPAALVTARGPVCGITRRPANGGAVGAEQAEGAGPRRMRSACVH